MKAEYAYENSNRDFRSLAKEFGSKDSCEDLPLFAKGGFTMTIGAVFYILAAIVLFLGGIGSTIIPNSVIWGLFCIALGLLLGCYDFGLRRAR